MTLKEQAFIYYNKYGWNIIPCRGKIPLIQWIQWQINRIPPKKIEQWWAEYPDANIGVITGGVSGVVVLDTDGADISGLHLPLTATATTTPGHFHYYYKYPGFKVSNSAGQLAEGLDFRGDGGFVVLPPSQHFDKETGLPDVKYTWLLKPSENGFSDMPSWLADKVKGKTYKSSKFNLAEAVNIPEGKRDDTLYKTACSLIAKGTDPDTALTILQGINATFKPPLEDQVVIEKLKGAIKFIETSRDTINDSNIPEGSKIPWPKPMAKEAFVGLAGEIVKTIEPHSESDRVALLINFLTGFGSVIGDQAHFKVEADKHPMRLFSVLVGESSRGRKGTSWGYIKQLLTTANPEWGTRVIGGGLSSGEGLIWAVRDQIIKRTPIKDHGHVTGYEEVIEDPGITDKRLLVVESELASTLRVLGREGNILSALIRNAWDSGNLQTLTKNSPAQATGAHIAIIGHITKEELLRYLTSTETSNGFGNRLMWVCVKRSKVLPYGGGGVDLQPLVIKLTPIISFAKSVDELTWAEGTISLWGKIYIDLTEEEPGLVGSMTARSEAYITRIACIYALLDRSTRIRITHLKAAVAVWDYARASTEYIFQGKSGDPLANKIIEALSGKPEGMTRTDIYNYFGKNISSEQISISLKNLEKIGRIKKDDISPEGRSKALFTLNTLNTCMYSEKNYLKKLNQYIDELGIKEDSSDTNNSGEDYANNVNNVLNPDNKISLNSLPGLENYGKG